MSQRLISRSFAYGYPLSDFGVGPDLQQSRDRIMRSLTTGAWGFTAADDVEHQLFAYHLPEFAGDYAQGGVCAATGYWGAGSGMVKADGMRFLKDFAPDRVNKPRG